MFLPAKICLNFIFQLSDDTFIIDLDYYKKSNRDIFRISNRRDRKMVENLKEYIIKNEKNIFCFDENFILNNKTFNEMISKEIEYLRQYYFPIYEKPFLNFLNNGGTINGFLQENDKFYFEVSFPIN